MTPRLLFAVFTTGVDEDDPELVAWAVDGGELEPFDEPQAAPTVAMIASTIPTSDRPEGLRVSYTVTSFRETGSLAYRHLVVGADGLEPDCERARHGYKGVAIGRVESQGV
jgi:hypothetical protein